MSIASDGEAISRTGYEFRVMIFVYVIASDSEAISRIGYEFRV